MEHILQHTLVLIPARAGSKGVPDKNVKPFAGGLSLVERACDVALEVFPASSIVVSSDSEVILKQAAEKGVVIRKRPEELASDTAGMTGVMLDALLAADGDWKYLLLLQPTSPFRNSDHLKKVMQTWEDGDEAVVSMHEAKSHPQFTLFKPHGEWVEKWSQDSVERRQDVVKAYEVNGLIYLFRTDKLDQPWTGLKKIRPMIVGKLEAMDIDTQEDWWLAELIAQSDSQPQRR